VRTDRPQIAWAIDLDNHERYGFAGIFIFTSKTYPYHDGNRTAVFTTRREAREALQAKSLKQPWKKAKVVKVMIVISSQITQAYERE
jgi:hypothetical protein